MTNKLFEYFSKESKLNNSSINTLKIVYCIFGVLILYLILCQISYGLGYLIAKL